MYILTKATRVVVSFTANFNEHLKKEVKMETLDILLVIGLVFWSIVFFLCLGPFLLLISKYNKNGEESMDCNPNLAQDDLRARLCKRHSAPSLMVHQVVKRKNKRAASKMKKNNSKKNKPRFA